MIGSLTPGHKMKIYIHCKKKNWLLHSDNFKSVLIHSTKLLFFSYNVVKVLWSSFVLYFLHSKLWIQYKVDFFRS